MQRILHGAMLRATILLGLLFGLAQTASAQNPLIPECPSPNPLCLDNNYFVTGDYVVGGVGLRGLGTIDPLTGNSLAKRTISIPDCVQAHAIDPNVNPNGPCGPPPVPQGADIVAAWLYWETVEATSNQNPPPHPGQNGFFKPLDPEANGLFISGNGYPISGTILGSPNAPSNWSSGGCVGSANGGKTLVGYRADVRPYLLQDANGNTQANGSFQVMLPDSGSNGGGTPLTLGASLVIIYRVLSSTKPLNSIVIYDGAFVPSNQSPSSSQMSQTMQGFYQAAGSPVVKLTHIVGDGQTNKGQSVMLGSVPLPNLYPSLSAVAAFPGVYNQSWDNPTWTAANATNPSINTAVAPGTGMVTTSVIPGSGNTGSGCVDWGAVILSTTVEEGTKHDGLLSAWKTGNTPGYTDAISVQNVLPNPFVALPGASTAAQDIFVEIDYVVLRGPAPAKPVLHSHLPKQVALDMVGDAFAKQNINIHFDVGGKYDGKCKVTAPQTCPDPYIIQGGTGGNEIDENVTLCALTIPPDPNCQFPNTPTVGWKGGYLFVKGNATVPGSNVPLGNFQFGRKSSYHYVLFGHALGEPRSTWTTYGSTLPDPNSAFAKLISISNATVGMGSTFLVTLKTPQAPQGTPQAILYPGFCSTPFPPPECSDANVGLITISGALGQAALNGTYALNNPQSSSDGTVVTTTFKVTIPGLPSGSLTYDFNNESRLDVEYLGPTSSSGHSDFPGGADSAVTFGLWPVDDPLGCGSDPSALAQGQTACNDQVGTVQAQAGTLLHELGHTLTLAHGGIFYPTQQNPNGTLLAGGQQANNSPDFVPPAFGFNCNPAILSSMNYLFQIRGFPELIQPTLMLPDGSQAHPIDYSGQTLRRSDGLVGLSETALNEMLGIGTDIFANGPAATAQHYTRWYGPPTAFQTQIGQVATAHCDGTPVASSEPAATRVNGSPLTEPGGFSGPIDWNNNGTVPDPSETVAPQDVNFNGTSDPDPQPLFNGTQGFNDWVNADLRQIGSRENTLGLSGGGSTGGKSGGGGSTGGKAGGGGATIYAQASGSTGGKSGGGGSTGGKAGGGGEQNVETACSTAPDPPSTLMATVVSKNVVLNWNAPGNGTPCRVNTYNIWRSSGGPFTQIAQLQRGPGDTPPATTFKDTTVLPGKTYTYFVTDTTVQGGTSAETNHVTIKVN